MNVHQAPCGEYALDHDAGVAIWSRTPSVPGVTKPRPVYNTPPAPFQRCFKMGFVHNKLFK